GMGWKAGLNGVAITVGDRFPATEPYRPRCRKHQVTAATRTPPAFGAYLRAPVGISHRAGLYVLSGRPDLRPDPLRQQRAPPIRAAAIAPEPIAARPTATTGSTPLPSTPDSRSA